MDWKNVDLSDGWQRDQNILDPYSFSDLLLEIHCNIKDSVLSREAILKQAKDEIRMKAALAIEIIENNAENVLKYELKEREELI